MLRPEQLRVVCVDDEPDILELLRVVVEYEPDFEIVATTTDARQIIDLVCDHHPDVLIVDQRIDGPRVDIVTTLRDLAPDATVAVFSGRDRPTDNGEDLGDVWVQKPDWASLWPAIRAARRPAE